jgi:uncharacterized BrkB/YihY/UPF0761 family membrane protein
LGIIKKRIKPTKSFHQKQLVKASFVLGALLILVFGLFLWLVAQHNPYGK